MMLGKELKITEASVYLLLLLLLLDRERQSLSLEGVVSSEGTMPLDLLTTREGAYMLI